jgi:hypothetical protein
MDNHAYLDHLENLCAQDEKDEGVVDVVFQFLENADTTLEKLITSPPGEQTWAELCFGQRLLLERNMRRGEEHATTVGGCEEHPSCSNNLALCLQRP